MENEANTKEKGLGGVIGAIIIIVILAVGAWYFIGGRVEKIQEQKANVEVGSITTGSSTEVEDIQTDLNNLNLNALNQ